MVRERVVDRKEPKPLQMHQLPKLWCCKVQNNLITLHAMNVALSQLWTQNNCRGRREYCTCTGISKLILCNITPRLTVRMNPEYQINLIKPHSIRSHYRPQRSWGKVMFLQASVILLMGGVSVCLPQCMLGYTPPEQTPPEWTPPWSKHPLGADTPPRSRHPPWEQTPTADTPWEQTPQEQIPPGSKYTPPGSRHPPQQTPPGSRHLPPEQSMLEDTVNARAVRILLECNLVSNK